MKTTTTEQIRTQGRDDCRDITDRVQHPESVDPAKQTFEEGLVFEVQAAGKTKEIPGGRTRTRLLLPQRFRSPVGQSGVIE